MVNRSRRTAELYRDLLERHIEPAFGSVALSHIRPDAVRAWHSDLAARVSPLQAAKAYGLLRSILKTAVDDRLLAENPCRIAGAGIERSAERSLVAPEDVLRFADAIDARYRALVLVAAFGGLRLGELLALQRRHFDARAQTLTVKQQASDSVAERALSRRQRRLPAGVARISRACRRRAPATPRRIRRRRGRRDHLHRLQRRRVAEGHAVHRLAARTSPPVGSRS